jgi:hypothetical protein
VTERGWLAVAIVAIAGCGSATGAPPGARAPTRRPLPDARASGDATSAPPPSPSMPDREVDVPGVTTCVPAASGLPGQPSPDARLLALLVAHPWCHDGDVARLELTFQREGVLVTVHAAYATASAAAGREESTGCWALAGDDLLLRSVGTRWDVWPLRDDGSDDPGLVWRGMVFGRCSPPPPPLDPAHPPP